MKALAFLSSEHPCPANLTSPSLMWPCMRCSSSLWPLKKWEDWYAKNKDKKEEKKEENKE